MIAPKNFLMSLGGKGMTIYNTLEKNDELFYVAESDLIIIGRHHTRALDDWGFAQYVAHMYKSYGKRLSVLMDGTKLDILMILQKQSHILKEK